MPRPSSDLRRAGAAPVTASGRPHTPAGPNALHCEVRGGIGPLIAALAPQPIVALTTREPSLEEIFLHHYDAGGVRAGG